MHLVEAQASAAPAEGDTMVVGAVVAVVAVVVILVGALTLARQARRRRELPAVAAAHGLQYSDVDRFDSTRPPFDLFRAGDGRRVEHLMWDEAGDARVFDYAYYVERRDEHGRVTKTWSTFTCALCRHDGSWPELRLLRERLFDRALARIGLPDLDLESEEFNRTFVVQCRDRRFATALLDARMQEALLAAPAKANVESKGRWVLVWSRRRPPAELPAMLRTAEAFCERIPQVVRDLYGSIPSDMPLDPMTLGIPPVASDSWRDPAWDVLAGGVPGAVGSPWIGTDEVERSKARREMLTAAEGQDREPAVEYDLDGNAIAPGTEDPWGDGRPPR